MTCCRVSFTGSPSPFSVGCISVFSCALLAFDEFLPQSVISRFHVYVFIRISCPFFQSVCGVMALHRVLQSCTFAAEVCTGRPFDLDGAEPASAVAATVVLGGERPI